MSERNARQDLLSNKLVIPSDFIVIVGCGGSGFNTAMLTAMAGCKKFILIDHDTLDETNRNRLFTLKQDIGRPKVEILKDVLMTQGVDQVICYTVQATYLMLQALNTNNKLSAIVSCVDTFRSIKMIADFCLDFGIRMVRAGSDDDKISYATSMGGLIDLDGEDGYQVFPNWIGGTMMSAVLASYLILYPNIETPVTTIPVFETFFPSSEVKGENSTNG